MKNHCFKFLLIVLFVLFPMASHSQPSQIKTGLQQLTDDIRYETNIPGISVYVISKELGEFGIVSGVVDLNTGEKVSQRTVFRMGSITKTFTGAAIKKLVLERKLDLNREASHYLNLEYPILNGITVRHLLNHSSGLKGYLNETIFLTEEVLKNPEKFHSPEELLDWALSDQESLQFEPGSKFAYNNTNYILLGLIIEKIVDIPYKDYLENTFIQSLNLTETYILMDEGMPGDDYAHGYYDMDEDFQYEDWTGTNMSYVWSAGCMAGTAQDLAKWINFLGKRFILNQIFLGVTPPGIMIEPGIFYGAGLVRDTNKGIGHNGTVVGFHADAWYSPRHRTTIAVLSNANMIEEEKSEGRDPTLEIVQEFFEILDEHLNNPEVTK